jgi:hypothetical protein
MLTCKLFIQLNLFLRLCVERIAVFIKLVLVVFAVVMGSGEAVAAEDGADTERAVIELHSASVALKARHRYLTLDLTSSSQSGAA